jgi:hypothetical protein
MSVSTMRKTQSKKTNSVHNISGCYYRQIYSPCNLTQTEIPARNGYQSLKRKECLQQEIIQCPNIHARVDTMQIKNNETSPLGHPEYLILQYRRVSSLDYILLTMQTSPTKNLLFLPTKILEPSPPKLYYIS